MKKQKPLQVQTPYSLALLGLAFSCLLMASIFLLKKCQSVSDNNQSKSASSTPEEIYWKLWDTDLQHMTIRWNVTTFFISISFGILGFSFQSSLTLMAALGMRASSLLIYWFAYLLYLYFHDFNQVVRNYQTKMEELGTVSFDIQKMLNQTIRGTRSKRGSTTKLLFYFGLSYTISMIIISIFVH